MRLALGRVHPNLERFSVNSAIRIVALLFIFLMATAAWMVLGGVMNARSSSQQGSLYGSVAELWGQPLEQKAPVLRFEQINYIDRQ